MTNILLIHVSLNINIIAHLKDATLLLHSPFCIITGFLERPLQSAAYTFIFQGLDGHRTGSSVFCGVKL